MRRFHTVGSDDHNAACAVLGLSDRASSVGATIADLRWNGFRSTLTCFLQRLEEPLFGVLAWRVERKFGCADVGAGVSVPCAVQHGQLYFLRWASDSGV